MLAGAWSGRRRHIQTALGARVVVLLHTLRKLTAWLAARGGRGRRRGCSAGSPVRQRSWPGRAGRLDRPSAARSAAAHSCYCNTAPLFSLPGSRVVVSCAELSLIGMLVMWLLMVMTASGCCVLSPPVSVISACADSSDRHGRHTGRRGGGGGGRRRPGCWRGWRDGETRTRQARLLPWQSMTSARSDCAAGGSGADGEAVEEAHEGLW